MSEQIVTGLVPPVVTNHDSPAEVRGGECRGLPLPVITRRRELPVIYGMVRMDSRPAGSRPDRSCTPWSGNRVRA